jgi:4-hydroxybutyryl-CoA dehydratase / vinylacetyl-CoA-Delta-isomerase
MLDDFYGAESSNFSAPGFESLFTRESRCPWPGFNPLLRPTLENIGETYDLAQREEGDLFTEFSPLIGERVNRYCHVPRKREEMVKRIKMDRRLGNLTGMSNYRSTGADASTQNLSFATY